MKNWAFLTLSSFVISGAIAQTNYQNQPIPNQKSSNTIDDNNRKAILAALGTTEEASHNTVKPPIISNNTNSNNTNNTKEVPTKSIVAESPMPKNPIIIKPQVPILNVQTKDIVKPTILEPTENLKKDIKKNSILIVQPQSLPKKKTIKYHKKPSTIIKKPILITEINLHKDPLSVSPPIYMEPAYYHYVNNQDLFTSIKKVNSNLVFSIKKQDGTSLELKEFKNNTQINAYIVSNDLNTIIEENINILSNQTDYRISNVMPQVCQTIFIQYYLNSSPEVLTLIQYIDHKGELSSSIDTSCKKGIANNQDNVTYSAENNIFGIFINNISRNSQKPLKYTIINNKNGQTFPPSALKSYIISKDFHSIYRVKPSNSNSITIAGVSYEQKLPIGSYFIIGQFPGEKTEQQIVVETSLY